MKKTIFAAAALSIALATGGAFAQSNENTAAQADSTNNEALVPFFTDDTMATPRTPDEIRTIFGGMETAEQDSLREQCKMAVERDQPENNSETMPAGFPVLCETVMTL